MERGFRNRQDWLTLSLAMVVWTAHFALAWGASVIFPTHPAARWIGVALTIGAAGALVFLWRRSGTNSVFTVPGLSIALAGAGVGYGMLPALIG